MTGADSTERPDWSITASALATALSLCEAIDDPSGLDQAAASWRDGIAAEYGLDVTDERTAYALVVGLMLPVESLTAHGVPVGHPQGVAILDGMARSLAYLLPALPPDVQELGAARLAEIVAKLDEEADS